MQWLVRFDHMREAENGAIISIRFFFYPRRFKICSLWHTGIRKKCRLLHYSVHLELIQWLVSIAIGNGYFISRSNRSYCIIYYRTRLVLESIISICCSRCTVGSGVVQHPEAERNCEISIPPVTVIEIQDSSEYQSALCPRDNQDGISSDHCSGRACSARKNSASSAKRLPDLNLVIGDRS